MSPSAAEDKPRPTWMSALRELLSVVLAMTALVLATRLFGELSDGHVDVLAAGETLPLSSAPYGVRHTVMLPGYEIELTLGQPLDSLDYEFVEHSDTDSSGDLAQELKSSDGGSLVPLAWRALPTGEVTSPSDAEIRLVVGDETVMLDRRKLGVSVNSSMYFEWQPMVVALSGKFDGDDLTVEVEFDGLTQVLDVGSGEIDAGVAHALYEPLRSFDTGCVEVEDDCGFAAVSAKQPFHPYSLGFIASQVTLYPWDKNLGWAAEGSLWAGVRIHSSGAYGTDAAGNITLDARQSAPHVSLDGRPLAAREGLKGGSDSTFGWATFQVDSEVAPKILEIRQIITLGNGIKMPVKAVLPLAPGRPG